MALTINSVIFVAFLAFNLIIGLMSSKGVNTIRGFAIGDKKFNTATIVSTIVATYAGGQYFFTTMTESYNKGLGVIIVFLAGGFLSMFLSGKIFAPRMSEFLDNFSIAEAMGSIYGKNARIITAISGFIAISGIIAMQLKISGILFEYAMGVGQFYGIVLSGIIITLHSSLGGVKSVTFTDAVQFIAFGVIIPSIAYFLLEGVDSDQAVLNTLTTNALFDVKKVISFSNPEIYSFFSLFVWIAIPAFDPAIFQRVAMAKNAAQASQSFVVSAFIWLFLTAVICWIGVLALTIYPNLQKSDIFNTIISEYNWIWGFKGLILAGIMAMIMSTVDSYVNSSSVLLIHDLRQTIGTNLVEDELRATRICSMFIGLISIVFAVKESSLLQTVIWASMFYMPVVTVPFLLAVLGFRSSNKAALLGMGAGFTTAMIWDLFFKTGYADGLVPGMLANLLFLFGSHYLLKQPGGWVKITIPKENTSYEEFEEQTEPADKANSYGISNFVACCRRNLPKEEFMISLLGVFMLISTFAASNSMPKVIRAIYPDLLAAIYVTTLSASMAFVSYPMWSDSKKQYPVMPILWNLVIFLGLICSSFFAVLITNFAAMQLILFMVNVLIISSVMKWRPTLCFLGAGVVLTFITYKLFLSNHQVDSMPTSSVEFKITYLLLLIVSVLIVFLKPREDYMRATENKNRYLSEENKSLVEQKEILDFKVDNFQNKIAIQEKEIKRLSETAQRILNNVNHELRLPVGNVMNFAEMLGEGIDKFNEDQLKMISEEVVKNSNRLSTMILNMLDLAMLEAKKIELAKTTLNMSEMVAERSKRCFKNYAKDKKLKFGIDIEPEILAKVDANYMRQVVDNIVINAISYTPSGGEIKVTLKADSKNLLLEIKDTGLGIPETEKYTIFEAFAVSSKTLSKAEGRGLGLALCKRAVEAHGGKITVDSDGKQGAHFKIFLPLGR